MAIEITDVLLTRDERGMMRVAVKAEGKWVEVISDAGELANHYVTSAGLALCVERPETPFEKYLNTPIYGLVY